VVLLLSASFDFLTIVLAATRTGRKRVLSPAFAAGKKHAFSAPGGAIIKSIVVTSLIFYYYYYYYYYYYKIIYAQPLQECYYYYYQLSACRMMHDVVSSC
jgi:hypothetical protein